jgi:tetratricopeptide (TPR) repeat protein
MKTFFAISIGLLLCIPFEVLAQDTRRLIRQASRELNRFNLDPMANQENLQEAKDLIAEALEGDDGRNEFRAWQTQGEIHNASLTFQMTMIQMGELETLRDPNEAMIASRAFQNALELADRRHEFRDALDGLTEAAGHLGFIGNGYINAGQFGQAFMPLKEVYDIHLLLKENDREPIFDDDEELNNHLYVMGICGLQAGERELAEEYLKILYDQKYDESRVYTTLFDLYIDEDEEKAMKFLQTGKEVDPENIDILYAEINYFIQKDDIEQLQEKLTIAIDKDPENHTLYNVLGNVFMNLMTDAMEEGDSAQADEHFEMALDYLTTAIELEPDFFEPYYTIGSMYFNRAAVITQKMDNLGMSREDQVKYEELNKEAAKLFDEALPYFQKSESLEPNDPTTLIALREVYARKQEFEMVQEFADRLNRIEAGEKIESPYFDID